MKSFWPLGPTMTNLLFGSISLSVLLIVFLHAGMFPLGVFEFVMAGLLGLIFALYRTELAFLVFVGLLPFEILNLAPESFGIALRPYQLAGLIVFAATIARMIVGRLRRDVPKIALYDGLAILLIGGAFATAFWGGDNETLSSQLKQAIILASFFVSYGVVRIFVQTLPDMQKATWAFLTSGVVASSYAVWQNIRFASGAVSLEVMPGRPNALFAEADWLGGFLALAIACALTLALGLQSKKRLFAYGAMSLLFAALILTVARSAWLATACTLVVFGTVWSYDVWLRMEGDVLKRTFGEWWRAMAGVGLSLVMALSAVIGFDLTTFELGNRASSATSGLQSITVACDDASAALPSQIVSTDELAQYGCRHINLEEKEVLAASGKSVREVLRNDPNADIRKNIYKKSFEILEKHWLLGVGYSAIPKYLGTDERGVGLNTSNIFLEIWLGSGLVGFAAFVWLWMGIAWRSVKGVFGGGDRRLQYVFVLLSWVALTVFNMFNAGLMLGFFWAWLAVAIGSASSDWRYLKE